MELTRKDIEEAAEQFKSERPMKPDTYFTAGTGLSDDMAIWLFKECNVYVITRDGSKWLKGVKIK